MGWFSRSAAAETSKGDVSKERFTGTVEYLGDADPVRIWDWLGPIPFSEWPKQSNGLPAMLTGSTDLASLFYPMYSVSHSLVSDMMGRFFPGCESYWRLISAVMPGEGIDEHTDEQGADWLTRVHVPLTSPKGAQFIVEGKPYTMEVGKAYRVNTLKRHAVKNTGTEPRIHFMFDVRNRALLREGF